MKSYFSGTFVALSKQLVVFLRVNPVGDVAMQVILEVNVITDVDSSLTRSLDTATPYQGGHIYVYTYTYPNIIACTSRYATCSLKISGINQSLCI